MGVGRLRATDSGLLSLHRAAGREQLGTFSPQSLPPLPTQMGGFSQAFPAPTVSLWSQGWPCALPAPSLRSRGRRSRDRDGDCGLGGGHGRRRAGAVEPGLRAAGVRQSVGTCVCVAGCAYQETDTPHGWLPPSAKKKSKKSKTSQKKKRDEREIESRCGGFGAEGPAGGVLLTRWPRLSWQTRRPRWPQSQTCLGRELT